MVYRSFFLLQEHRAGGRSGRKSSDSQGHDIFGTHGSALTTGRRETRTVGGLLGGKLLVHFINHLLRAGRGGDAAVGPAGARDHSAETVLLVTGHLRGIAGNVSVPNDGVTDREDPDRVQETR